MLRYIILSFALVTSAANAHNRDWIPAAIGGVILGTIIEDHHHEYRPQYVPQYSPPPQVIVIQPQMPSYQPQYAPARLPVDIDRYGRPYCPPGYHLWQRVNNAGYVENVGCVL